MILIKPPRLRPTMGQVIETVACYFDIAAPDAVRWGSSPHCIDARRYAVTLARRLDAATDHELAGAFVLDRDEVDELAQQTRQMAHDGSLAALELDVLAAVLRHKAWRPWCGRRLDRVVRKLAREMRAPAT